MSKDLDMLQSNIDIDEFNDDQLNIPRFGDMRNPEYSNGTNRIYCVNPDSEDEDSRSDNGFFN